MKTTQPKPPYPTIKVILRFGSIGFLMGSVLGLLVFIGQQKALYDLKYYGKLMQKDTISYEFAFLAPVIIIGLYAMLVAAILAYQQTLWRKRYVDKIVYLRLIWASLVASVLFSVFLIVIDLSPFFAVIFFPLQFIFTLISTILFLPKAKA